MGDISVKGVKLEMMRSNSKSEGGVGYNCVGDNYNYAITCSKSEMRAEWIIYVCEQ